MQNYELAFHLIPDLSESELSGAAKQLEELITQNNGSILRSPELKRFKLAYPIKHKKYSFFGAIQFAGPKELIEKLTEQLKLKNELLRYAVMKKEPGEKLLTSIEPRKERPKAKFKEEKKAQIKPEELERQIEEIIGKL